MPGTMPLHGALLLLLGAAQLNTGDVPPNDNQLVLEAEAFGAALSYSRRVSGDWYLGGSGGLGLGRRFSTITNERFPDTRIWELAHADLVAGYQPTTLFQLELGLRVAMFAYDSPMQGDFAGGFVGGAVGGVWLGWRYLKFGSRLEVVEVLDGESRLGILWQPLMVRGILAWGDTTPD